MAIQTCMGATMKCSFGLAPSKLIPTPKTVMTSNMVAANIMDHMPNVQYPPFRDVYVSGESGRCCCDGNAATGCIEAPALHPRDLRALGLPERRPSCFAMPRHSTICRS